MTTLLTEIGASDVDAKITGEDLWLSSDTAATATGWALKPEGICKGPVCVPIPAVRASEFVSDGNINIATFWRHMGRPILHDAARETWVLGESAADRSAQLQSLEAPDFTLPDIDGNLHSLSDYRGKKVYLCSWASW